MYINPAVHLFIHGRGLIAQMKVMQPVLIFVIMHVHGKTITFRRYQQQKIRRSKESRFKLTLEENRSLFT
jgi:hypothetical protein